MSDAAEKFLEEKGIISTSEVTYEEDKLVLRLDTANSNAVGKALDAFFYLYKNGGVEPIGMSPGLGHVINHLLDKLADKVNAAYDEAGV